MNMPNRWPENIDYGFTEARTLAGKVGIKCWICSKDSEF